MMSKKHLKFIYYGGLAFCLIILVIAVKLLSDRSYRTQIPSLPDFQPLPFAIREQISEAGTRAVKNPTSDNLGMLGMVYHSSAFYNEAARCYRLAVRKNKKKWIWNYYLGYLSQELGDSKTSIDNFQKVLDQNPKIDLALYYKGEAFQNLGLFPEAEIVFDKVVDLDASSFNENILSINNYFPLRTYAMFQLARIYMNSGRLENAEETLEGIINNYLSFGPAYRLLGNVYTLKGDPSKGALFTTKANDLTNYFPPVDTIIDKLALMSRSEVYLIKQIDVALRRLNPKWAMDLLSSTKEYFPDSKYLTSKAIKLYLWLGMGNEALPFLDRHLTYYSEDFKELTEVAELLYDNGFKSESMTYFSRAKSIDPEDAGSQARLALWLGERGMSDDAVSMINELLKNNKNNSMVLSRGFYLFMVLGQSEKAIDCLDRLKLLLPMDPEVNKMSGMISETQGNIKAAISFYETALKGNPKDITCVEYLNSLYLREKMWEKAMMNFRTAMVSYPNNPYLLEGLGKLLIFCPDTKLRNLNEGIEFSERAFIRSTSPSDTQISAGINLATALSVIGERRKAYTYINLTVNLARKRNVSKEYMEYLESLLKKLSFTN